tara:strand:- start:33 stop:1199 length:1167 start_codon:yes stop_codon:yes gene_type:complete
MADTWGGIARAVEEGLGRIAGSGRGRSQSGGRSRGSWADRAHEEMYPGHREAARDANAAGIVGLLSGRHKDFIESNKDKMREAGIALSHRNQAGELTGRYSSADWKDLQDALAEDQAVVTALEPSTVRVVENLMKSGPEEAYSASPQEDEATQVSSPRRSRSPLEGRFGDRQFSPRRGRSPLEGRFDRPTVDASIGNVNLHPDFVANATPGEIDYELAVARGEVDYDRGGQNMGIQDRFGDRTFSPRRGSSPFEDRFNVGRSFEPGTQMDMSAVTGYFPGKMSVGEARRQRMQRRDRNAAGFGNLGHGTRWPGQDSSGFNDYGNRYAIDQRIAELRGGYDKLQERIAMMRNPHRFNMMGKEAGPDTWAALEAAIARQATNDFLRRDER